MPSGRRPRTDPRADPRIDPSCRQCADAVLLVRPAAFGFNAETARSNTFQQRPQGSAGEAAAVARAAEAARAELGQLAAALRSEGVSVHVAEDSAKPVKPDAVFPNNWVSFHEGGTVVLYPMESPSRRAERRREVVDAAARELGFTIERIVDLTHFESQGRFLEGTGSLVLDRVRRIAYACLSPRTHPEVIEEWARELGYQAVTFAAADERGVPIYHTNVLLFIGERVAVIGAEAIAAGDRERVLASLAVEGREVIPIGHAEIGQFVGNMLELGTWDEALGDARVIVMSASARRALQEDTYARLSGCTDTVLAVPVPTIERLGGGSVRCMIAEVFRG